MKKPLLEPRFLGRRFDDHTIPLELLKDIAVLEEFIIAVAKWLFVQEHGRVRSPKGFTAPLQISLSAINEGSAKPAIVFEYEDPASGLFPAANEDYFSRAVSAIGNAIDAAERNQVITDHLPSNLLGYFDRFGRGLLDGETLEFFPDAHRPARLTKVTRRRLLMASGNEDITDSVTVRGRISELDQAKMSFEIQLCNGRKITAPVDTIHLETILEATKGYRSGVKVSISGIARFDRHERLDSFAVIEDAVILETNDPLARLDELRLLKPGWLEGNGRVPAADDFDWLESFLGTSYPASLPTPFIYPTEAGGIQLEWRTGNQDLSFEIDFSSRIGEVHGINIVSNEETYYAIRIDDTNEMQRLVDTISAAAKGEI